MGVCAILVYMILEGIILKQILDAQYKVNEKLLGVKLASMGFYYNLVTPFASEANLCLYMFYLNIKFH